MIAKLLDLLLGRPCLRCGIRVFDRDYYDHVRAHHRSSLWN